FKYGTNDKCNYVKVVDDDVLPILRIPNVVGSKINYEDLKFTKRNTKIDFLNKGDLIFVRTNGNPRYIGRCAVFMDSIECGYASYLIKTQIKELDKFLPEFVQYIISFP